MVTPAALTARWLWLRSPWGVVAAIVLNVKGALYATLLAIGSASGGPVAAGGADGLLGLWSFFAVGSLAALAAVLLPERPPS